MNGIGGHWIAATAACFALLGVALVAEEASYTPGEKLFALQVKPLLKQKCFACHGDEERVKGDLDLTSRSEMLFGGETSDQVLAPGDGSASLLYQALTWELDDYEMPPKEADRLTEDQTWLIRDWIDAGAPWPSDTGQAIILEKYSKGVVVLTNGGLDDDWTNRRYEKENLWAYQPLKNLVVPFNSKQVHPIDAFINQQLDQLGLAPALHADRQDGFG